MINCGAKFFRTRFGEEGGKPERNADGLTLS
jgi:hypothetical protein